jgi:cell division protein ZapB
LNFPHYSARMESELNSLESKIQQMLELCQNLRTENQKLRQQIAALGGDNKVLTERMIYARTRMESLLEKIPEGDEA